MHVRLHVLVRGDAQCEVFVLRGHGCTRHVRSPGAGELSDRVRVEPGAEVAADYEASVVAVRREHGVQDVVRPGPPAKLVRLEERLVVVRSVETPALGGLLADVQGELLDLIWVVVIRRSDVDLESLARIRRDQACASPS